MALRLAALLLALLLCALSVPSNGAFPKCCVTTTKFIRPSILRRVESIVAQKSSGACEVPALILIVKGKMYCAHPAVLRIVRRMQKPRRQKKRAKKNQKKRLGM